MDFFTHEPVGQFPKQCQDTVWETWQLPDQLHIMFPLHFSSGELDTQAPGANVWMASPQTSLGI